MTYPENLIREIISAHAVPVQIDNTKPENNALLHKIHHIWTPDIRIIYNDGYELYTWGGYLPPFEYAARLLCGFGLAYLRLKHFDKAEECYLDVLRRFSTSYAAAEAQYYLGVTRYRKDPNGDELLTQWANLRSRYPMSEFRVKQSFKDLPDSTTSH